MANLANQLNTKANGGLTNKLGPARFDGNIFVKSDPTAKTFAESLAELKLDNKSDLVKEIIKHAQEGKSGEEILTAIKKNPETLELFKSAQKTLMARQETLKQQGQEIASDLSKGHAEEAAKKLKPTESVIAAAGQANNKQGAEELAKQEANNIAVNEDANNRKGQLANWHTLAPRIMEDTKLKAVRIDIPGIEDLQTLIVKSTGSGSVRIDVVGSEETMKILNSKQGELRNRLSKHEINLSDLKTYFSKNVRQAKEKGNV